MTKLRVAALATAILSCAEPPKPTPSPAATSNVSPPVASTIPSPPPATSAVNAETEPAPGTRIVVAEKKTDDSWDKMLVKGGRVYVLTDVNKWTSGPMYVPAARLWSAPLTGGELTRHLDLEGLASLAADDSSLYVAVARDLSTMNTPRAKNATGRIFRIPLSGAAAPVDLATGISPSVFALDGDTLWFDGFRMPKDGSKPPTASGVKGALAFAFDEDNVYVSVGKGSGEPTRTDGKNGRVLRLSKKGGAPTVLARGLPDEPSGLAVDSTHVYVAAVAWGSDAAENAGVIARVAKQGGELEVLAAQQPLPRAAWLGPDHLYVRLGRPGRPGSIVRVAKGGGAVEEVVTDSTLVSATMSGNSLYFSSDGTFRKEPFERISPAVLVRLVNR